MQEVLHFLNQMVDVLNWVAQNIPWAAVIASGVLSPLLLVPKRYVTKYVTKYREQVMIMIVGLSGFLVAGFHYLMSTPTQSPSIIALQGFALAFGTQPFYFIMVKPAIRLINDWFAAQVALASQINEAKTAIEPVGGVTPAAVTEPAVGVQVQDFNN